MARPSTYRSVTVAAARAADLIHGGSDGGCTAAHPRPIGGRPRLAADLWTTVRASARGDDHREHAGPDVGADHGADLADTSRSQRRDPPAQPVGERRRPAPALARWCTATSTGRLPAAADRDLLEPGDRLRRGAHLLQRLDVPVDQVQQRLHRQRRPEQRGGRADPATAPQVLERVDVEDGGARPPRASPRRLGDLVDRTPPRPPRPPRTARRSRGPCRATRSRRPRPGTGDSLAASRADSTVPDICADRCTETTAVAAARRPPRW